jgi:methyltransferase (TIGR00027 family)
MPIEHVSDTALWVASHRAAESARPDALFHDRLAGVLAGERGREIAQSMPGGEIMAWVMAVRTVAIDQFVLNAIRLGADTVLNIGAGLDTRPYRMELPASLRWIEVDFPSMIEYKTERLRDQQPVCRLEHVALDLTDAEARRTFLKRIGQESGCVAVLTEGVLPYLTKEAVGELADEIHAIPQLRYWIQDYYKRGNVRQSMPLPWREKLRAAPMRFDVDDWFTFFAAHGWRVKEHVTMMEQARRVGRRFPFVFPSSLRMILKFVFMSPAKRKEAQEASGYAMLERAD